MRALWRKRCSVRGGNSMRRVILDLALALAGSLFFIVYLWAAISFVFLLGAPYVPAP